MFDQITIPQVITWIALAVAIAACAGTVHYARRAEAAARRAQAASERAQKHAKWAHVHTVRAQAAADRALAAASRAEAAAARIPAWGFGGGRGGASTAPVPPGRGGGNTVDPHSQPGGGGHAVDPQAVMDRLVRKAQRNGGYLFADVADAVGTTDDTAEADR